MENVKPLDSKKWTMTIAGMLGIMLSGAAAVAAGPVGISALPYVVAGIVGIVGGGVITQGVQDTKTNVAAANNSAAANNAPACSEDPPK